MIIELSQKEAEACVKFFFEEQGEFNLCRELMGESEGTRQLIETKVFEQNSYSPGFFMADAETIIKINFVELLQKLDFTYEEYEYIMGRVLN